MFPFCSIGYAREFLSKMNLNSPWKYNTEQLSLCQEVGLGFEVGGGQKYNNSWEIKKLLAASIAEATDGSVWVFFIVVMQKKSRVTGECRKAVIVGTAAKPGNGRVLQAGGRAAAPWRFGSSLFLQSCIWHVI